MNYRKLRIACSVGCGVACLLLIALWVRSYQIWDDFSKRDANGLQTSIGSNEGSVYLHRSAFAIYWMSSGWSHSSQAANESLEFDWQSAQREYSAKYPWTILIFIPYWYPVLPVAVAAAVPWFRWRFSLRTLLIVTAAAAIALGWIVYSTRK